MSKGFKHGGGGGADPLNFKIVGGDTAPGSPKDNMIWVNTPTKIDGWSISNVEPDSPAPGMVWVKVAPSGKIQFNALKKNVLTIYPAAVQQYESGAWVRKGAKIYQSEEWREIDTSLYIYNNGTSTGYSWKCNETMKQTSSGHTAVASRVTVGDTTVTVKCTTRGYDFTNIFTTDSSGSFVKVDLSEYTKVRIKGAVSGASTDTACVFRVLSEMGDLCTKNNVLSQSLYTGTIDATIDISSVNTSGYIGFTLYNSNQGVPELVLSELWLE